MLHILNALMIGSVLGLLVVGAKRLVLKLLVIFNTKRENKKNVRTRPPVVKVVDVGASPLKAFDFLEGGIEGRVVVFGPFNGVAKRTLLLWKNGKHRCIRMDVVSSAKGVVLDDLYRNSITEAREIANKVFSKRKSKPQSPATERAPPQHKETSVVETQTVSQATSQFAPVAESKPVSLEPNQAEGEKREGVIIKGFKAQYTGRMVEAKAEPHVKTNSNGLSEEFTSFTLTLETDDGLERMLGNDLKRALSAAEAEKGDNLKVIYVKDQTTPNGFQKKQYQIINLSKTGRLV